MVLQKKRLPFSNIKKNIKLNVNFLIKTNSERSISKWLLIIFLFIWKDKVKDKVEIIIINTKKRYANKSIKKEQL